MKFVGAALRVGSVWYALNMHRAYVFVSWTMLFGRVSVLSRAYVVTYKHCFSYSI